jgi:ABC-type transporter Mla subunit MlaD
MRNELSGGGNLPGYLVTNTDLNTLTQDCEQTCEVIRQKREQAAGYMLQLEAMCRQVGEGLTSLQEQQASLQSTVTATLETFAEKAGSSQGLQGLFHGNVQLKQDILQRRGVLEQNCKALREVTYKLSQEQNQLFSLLRQVELLLPYFEQCEKDLQSLSGSLGQLSAGRVQQQPPAPAQEPALQ